MYAAVIVCCRVNSMISIEVDVKMYKKGLKKYFYHNLLKGVIIADNDSKIVHGLRPIELEVIIFLTSYYFCQ